LVCIEKQLIICVYIYIYIYEFRWTLLRSRLLGKLLFTDTFKLSTTIIHFRRVRSRDLRAGVLTLQALFMHAVFVLFFGASYKFKARTSARVSAKIIKFLKNARRVRVYRNDDEPEWLKNVERTLNWPAFRPTSL